MNVELRLCIFQVTAFEIPRKGISDVPKQCFSDDQASSREKISEKSREKSDVNSIFILFHFLSLSPQQILYNAPNFAYLFHFLFTLGSGHNRWRSDNEVRPQPHSGSDLPVSMCSYWNAHRCSASPEERCHAYCHGAIPVAGEHSLLKIPDLCWALSA